MALFLLRRASRQRVAAMIGVALHLLVVLQTGIVSFGFVMVGAVLCAISRASGAYAPRWRRWPTGRLAAGLATGH